MNPAAIIPVALALMPAGVLDDIPMEARQAFPILRAIGRALADAPDFVLVEVRERDEHVLVEKRGGSFHISVESDSENVQVSFPISVILSIANKLESLPAADSNFDAESGDAEDWEEDLAEIL